jgi:hypothetical protein
MAPWYTPGFIPDQQNMGQNMGQWRWWHTLSQWSTKTNNLGGFWGPTCQEPIIWYTHICTNTPCNQRCWGGKTCKLTSAHCKPGGQPQPLLIEVLDRRCSRRIHLVLLRNGFMILVNYGNWQRASLNKFDVANSIMNHPQVYLKKLKTVRKWRFLR